MELICIFSALLHKWILQWNFEEITTDEIVLKYAILHSNFTAEIYDFIAINIGAWQKLNSNSKWSSDIGKVQQIGMWGGEGGKFLIDKLEGVLCDSFDSPIQGRTMLGW